MRRRRVAWAFVAASIGCSAVDVALEPSGRDDTGSATTGASQGVTTQTPTETGADTAEPIGSSTDDAVGSSTTAILTSDSSGGSSDDGTADGLEGSPCNAEQEVCVFVQLDGTPSGFCGETLELHGITQPMAGGGWVLEDCGGCELCGGPKYSIDVLAPPDWAPAELPLCSRIAIDYAPMDATPWACAFVGVAIWGNDGLAEDPAPVYIASSITAAPPSALEGLVVDAQNVAPEACPRSGCCFEEPGAYTFTFLGAGLDEPLTLAEHEEVLAVDMFSRTYAARDLRSHAHKECGKIPHFDWVFVR